MLIKKIKRKLAADKENKNLLGNIISLATLQGVNYILPLLTIPYLVRVLGPEYFGLLAFSMATIMYFNLITEYGFNLSATRQISISRDDECKLNEIFSSVMIIKTALMLFCFGLMVLLVFSFKKFEQHWELYFLSFGVVIGNVLFPVWLFQGLERMKYISYLNIASKGFFTVCIFIFVQDKEDYLFVPFLTSVGFITTGVWSLYITKKNLNVHFYWQKKTTLVFQLVDGWHVFLSTIAISIYTVSSTFVLGISTNNTIVGYFVAADKIVQAFKGIYQPISQSIYPLIGKKLQSNKRLGLDFIRKTTYFIGFSMFAISTILFLSAESIVNLVLGEKYQKSVLLLQVMAFLPFIIALSNMFGVQTMLNLGYKEAFGKILLAGAFLGVGLNSFLVPMYEGLGASLALVIVEIFVATLMFCYLKFLKRG